MARKILLADDSVTAQNMGRKILTDAGYEVITVNNGSAALKRVADQKPDLIVLDVYMPGYSGLEVCQRLKDAHETSRIPILLTVGKLEPFKPEEARRVNADAFIVKPFEASELLSALTRLEDRMVPQAEGSRFSTSVSGIERFGGEAGFSRKADGQQVETDTGWKNRIRFPSKKPKVEEPEPEEDFGTTPFRDFKRPSDKPHAPSGTFPVSPVKQEPGLVPDIPRDITPDELDALSALAAKLDGPIPASEDIVPVGGKLGPAEIPAPVPETKPEPEASAVTTAVPQAAPEPASTAHMEAPAALAPEAAAAVQASEPAPSGETTSPPQASVEPAGADDRSAAADLAPAPVDREDEPMFAQAAAATEVAAEEREAKSADDIPAEPASVAAAPAEESRIQATPEEHPGASEPAKAEDQRKASVADGGPGVVEPEPVAAANSEPSAPPEESATAEHIPSEEELAEALRLLTPSNVQSETPAKLIDETVTVPADVVQALEEAGQRTGVIGRWTAEAVALSPEEASLSLEAEMFQKFPGGTSVPATAEAAPVTGETAEPPATASSTQEPAEHPGVEEVATTAAAACAQEAAPEQPVEQQQASADEEPEPAATTFADAIQHADGPEREASLPSSRDMQAPAGEAEAAAEASQESSSEEDAGGQESMGKVTKGKSGWHQIRTASAPAAASDPVQAAKEAEAEEAPRAMAAAAAGDGASATASTEASAIASIVDSVLADLRPKIVEEIAKKLAKKD